MENVIGCEICDISFSAEVSLSCFIVFGWQSFRVLGRQRHRKRPPPPEVGILVLDNPEFAISLINTE